MKFTVKLEHPNDFASLLLIFDVGAFAFGSIILLLERFKRRERRPVTLNSIDDFMQLFVDKLSSVQEFDVARAGARRAWPTVRL